MYMKKEPPGQKSKQLLRLNIHIQKEGSNLHFLLLNYAHLSQDHICVGTEKFKIYFLKIIKNSFYLKNKQK